MDQKDIEAQIIKVLETIRPYLNRDGGDIEFVSYKDGIVYVKMLGACIDCVGLDSTLNDGILSLLIEEVPSVIEVRNIYNIDDEF